MVAVLRPVLVLLAVGWSLPAAKAGAQSVAGCTLEPALNRAAAHVALEGAAGEPGALLRAVRAAGSDVPAVHSLAVGRGKGARLRRWLAELRDRADASLVCGQARDESGRLVLAAVRAGRIDVSGTHPRRLALGLAPGFARPHVVVRDARGEHLRLHVDAEGGLRVRLPSSVQLPATVQLVAEGPRGPRPVAERRIVAGTMAGETKPVEETMAAGAQATTSGDRLQSLRAAYGRGRLRTNRLLSRAARRHARRVCAEGRVAHEIDRGADPEARLAREGIRARVVGEVIGRASSAPAAFDRLVASPSHLMTMVDDRFTDVGWGRAESSGHVCLVAVFAAWPRYVPPH